MSVLKVDFLYDVQYTVLGPVVSYHAKFCIELVLS